MRTLSTGTGKERTTDSSSCRVGVWEGAELIPPGLTSGEVAVRVTAGQTNVVAEGSGRGFWQIVGAHVLTRFNLVVASGFALLLVLGQWRDALFGFAALGNTVIGVTQEVRAKRTLDRLAVLHRPRARVLRDELIQEIPVAGVVRDDVLLLKAGDEVAADAVVVSSGDGLDLDESVLTGESEPVSKRRGGSLLAGSTVVGGVGVARVVGLGDQSFAGALTAQARRFSLAGSEIRTSLDRVLRWVSWALLPVLVIVVVGQVQAGGGWEEAPSGGTWTEAVVGAVASVIAMIPLGLVLLTSVAFIAGATRLARQQVVVQQLVAIENLARVDVLCLDKTGTITDGNLVFDGVHPVGPQAPGWDRALAWFGADPRANATARCLAQAFPADGAVAVVSVPFSSARQWSAVTLAGPDDTSDTWLLGVPDLLVAGRPGDATVLGRAADLASSGLRTLLLSHASTRPGRDTDGEPVLPSDRQPVALLTARERIRPDAARILDYFRAEGVTLRIISGDDPRTVAAVAGRVGITAEGIDARTLPTDPSGWDDVLERHVAYGRMGPTQKEQLVRALQRNGHTVGMTGDGVNDVLAVKAADVGIAIGDAAAATRAVAHVVLLDGRFERLPAVLAEGRRVVANVEQISVLFLTKTVYAIGLSVCFGALLWSFPFLPRQLSATDGLTIGMPAFFLALLPNARSSRAGFLRRSLGFAVPAGLVVTAAVVVMHVHARAARDASPDLVRTASVVVLTLIGLWILVVAARPLDARRGVIVGTMLVGLVLMVTVPPVTDFFALGSLPPELLAESVGIAVVGCLAIEGLGRRRARGSPRRSARRRP